jgi:hypothetical protein
MQGVLGLFRTLDIIVGLEHEHSGSDDNRGQAICGIRVSTLLWLGPGRRGRGGPRPLSRPLLLPPILPLSSGYIWP